MAALKTRPTLHLTDGPRLKREQSMTWKALIVMLAAAAAGTPCLAQPQPSPTKEAATERRGDPEAQAFIDGGSQEMGGGALSAFAAAERLECRAHLVVVARFVEDVTGDEIVIEAQAGGRLPQMIQRLQHAPAAGQVFMERPNPGTAPSSKS